MHLPFVIIVSSAVRRWALGLIAGLMLLVGAGTLTGCERRPAAFAYRSAPTDGWEQGDTLQFHVDSLARTGRYQLTLGLRTSVAKPCPFQSVWIVMRQHWHHPDTVMTDTVECRLTNAKGDVTGDGVTLYTTTCPVKQLWLDQGASADISVAHIMRREILTGVADVGIRLDPVP